MPRRRTALSNALAALAVMGLFALVASGCTLFIDTEIPGDAQQSVLVEVATASSYQACGTGIASCGGSDDCAAIEIDSGTTPGRGFCSPICFDGACPGVDSSTSSNTGSCLLLSDGQDTPTHCLLTCSLDTIGVEGACPFTLSCREFNDGAICASE